MEKWARRLRSIPPIGFVADVVELYFVHQVGRAAAELSYYLVLTFFPILICLSAFVSKLNLNMYALLEQAEYVLPQGIYTMFMEYLGYITRNQSDGMLAAGLFMTLLFASAAVRGLMNIMHEVYGRATFLGFRQIVASVVFSLLLLITTYVALAVMVTSNWFFHLLGDLLKLDNLVEKFDTWQGVKYLVLISVVFLFLLLLYRFSAPWSKPRPPVVAGALLASVALTVASMIFSVFMENTTRYSLVYGSLTSVIMLLIWVYLCGTIIILGSVVNYVIDCRKKGVPPLT